MIHRKIETLRLLVARAFDIELIEFCMSYRIEDSFGNEIYLQLNSEEDLGKAFEM